MQKLRLGEVCAGYGGLGLAVEHVFDAETAWFSEFDAAPSKILAHHWPTVPNYGDMTIIDWARIEQVDILSGGTPCQDLSHAGKRRGMTEGTRSNLAVEFLRAVETQQPKYVVWENVRGAYSATADSDLEQCPGCMGDTGDGTTVLRALGRLLGSLADLGYDAEWRGLRAADVGACHGRYRVFVLARRRAARNADVAHVEGRRAVRWADADPQQSARPDRSAGHGYQDAAADRDDLGIDRGRERAEQNRGGQPADGGLAAAVAAGVGRGEGRAEHARLEGRPDALVGGASTDWGIYAPAIGRWESVMGRRAPSPTEPTGRDGNQRLSPRFTEWMMGLPDGWVTDPAIGISRNDQLKACGNGVVPQQAAAALSDMLAAFAAYDREKQLEVAA